MHGVGNIAKLYIVKSVEEAWSGTRLFVRKVVLGAKTQRKCRKFQGSVNLVFFCYKSVEVVLYGAAGSVE